MTWQPELDELRSARAHGARDGRARQGPAPARRRPAHGARAHRPADRPGSFHEVGAIAGKAEYDADGKLTKLTPSNCVMGRASIDGRPVIVLGDDFTVRGGSADATIPMKPILAERMANELRLPIIRIIEGSGGGGSVKTIETTGRSNLPGQLGNSQIHYQYLADNLGTVPVVALGLGSVAGLGAARLAASHYSIMTKTTSAMFVAGPPVVARARPRPRASRSWAAGRCSAGPARSITRWRRRRRRSNARAASCRICPRRSTACRRAASAPIRRPARGDAVLGDPARPAQGLQDAPDHRRRRRQGLLLRDGPACSAARSSPAWRGSTGCPWPSSPAIPITTAARWTADACAKIVRFVDLAETFHLPVVYLCDCPGFLIGLEAEKSATIRHGVRAMAAINQSSVPWCTVIVRNSFGVAGAAHVPAGRLADPLRLAVGLVGLAAARGRHRGGLSRRDRRGARPQGASSPRSRRGSTRCARRSARPKRSGSRRSSTRATRASCCASSPTSPSRCARPARAPSPCVRRGCPELTLSAVTIQGYRSVRSLYLPVDPCSVFVGANGVGKTNLYKALGLLRCAADGSITRAIAEEGGVESVLWAGGRRRGQPVRLILKAHFDEMDTASRWGCIIPTRSRSACASRPRRRSRSSR